MIRADARAVPLRKRSVHCVVTSPPYWGLREYGDDEREFGRNTLDDWVKEMRTMAAQVWDVLREDGLFWLNLGDTASGSGGAGGDYNKGGTKAGKPKWRQTESGLAHMQWCAAPARVATALQDDGWLLRSWITWDKGRLRPESLKHARRPGVSNEVIFMLAKDRGHRFYESHLAERGSVWHFSPRIEGPKHLAPFPLELAERCILPSTTVGDIVYDPCVGSGTTLRAAALHGRVGIGTDLYAGVER